MNCMVTYGAPARRPIRSILFAQGLRRTDLDRSHRMAYGRAHCHQGSYDQGSRQGMVAGGFFGARSKQHDRSVALAFSLAGLLALVLAAGAGDRHRVGVGGSTRARRARVEGKVA